MVKCSLVRRGLLQSGLDCTLGKKRAEAVVPRAPRFSLQRSRSCIFLSLVFSNRSLCGGERVKCLILKFTDIYIACRQDITFKYGRFANLAVHFSVSINAHVQFSLWFKIYQNLLCGLLFDQLMFSGLTSTGDNCTRITVDTSELRFERCKNKASL